MTQYRPPLLNLPPVVKNLLIINALFFLGSYVLSGKLGVNIYDYLGLHLPMSDLFRPHQFISHMFMHWDFLHLFSNMFALFMFGRQLEYVWGPKRFLIYYLITGLGASALHLFVSWIEYSSVIDSANALINTPNPDLFLSFVKDNYGTQNHKLMIFVNEWLDDPNNLSYIAQGKSYTAEIVRLHLNSTTAGASGAVFGILLAYGMLFPNSEILLLFPPIPLKAKYLVIGYGAFELYNIFQSQAGDNVAHFAHLGGMIFGFILIIF